MWLWDWRREKAEKREKPIGVGRKGSVGHNPEGGQKAAENKEMLFVGERQPPIFVLISHPSTLDSLLDRT